jgi:hypothetical protein
MKSANTGVGTSGVEVLNVSPHGFWLLVSDKEVFLSFQDYPWFRGATLGQLVQVELHHSDHLYWPALDVDLDLERIHHPETFPLIAQTPL